VFGFELEVLTGRTVKVSCSEIASRWHEQHRWTEDRLRFSTSSFSTELYLCEVHCLHKVSLHQGSFLGQKCVFILTKFLKNYSERERLKHV